MGKQFRATVGRVCAIGAIVLAVLVVTAPAEARLTGGSIEVCLAATNDMGGKPIQFSLNGGAPFTVKGGRCSGAIAITPGPIGVDEVSPDTATMAVDVKPSYRALSSDLPNAHAVVAVPAGSTESTRTIVTFTNAGSLGIPPGPTPTTTGTIQLCAATDNGMNGKPFQYSLNGSATFTVSGGACSGPLTTRSGTNIVTEAASGIGQVSAIGVTPQTRLRSTDIVHQQASMDVPAGSTALNPTRVTFTNVPPGGSTPPGDTTGDLKICKTSATPAFQGRLFSFAINAGPAFSIEAGTPSAPVCSLPVSFPIGTRVLVQELQTPNVLVSSITVSDGRGTGADVDNRNVTATVGAGTTLVTFDNEPVPIPQTGYLEVCKDVTSADVTGQFDFTVTAPGFSQVASAYAGQCTGPIAVPGGNVSITEAARQGIQLTSVSTLPADRLFSANLINRVATVEVPVGDVSTETQVHFVNTAVLGQLKVCKALAAGSDVLSGQTFQFDVTRHVDADVPGPTQRVSVIANIASTQCVIAGSFPVGEQIAVAEVAPDPSIDVSGEGTVTIASGINSITVTNRAMGTLEICKARIGYLTGAQPVFRFRIDGGGVLTVRAGVCSLPQRVTIGTHTVQELAENDYELDPTAPGAGIDVSPADRVVTKNTAMRTVSVTVPYGASGETLVSFANRVKLGLVKVCKQVPATSMDALGTTEFSYTVTVGGVLQAPITGITAGSCSLPVGPFPLLQPDASATAVSVLEDGAAATAPWTISDVTCSGCRQPAAKVYDVTNTTLLLGFGFNLGPDVNALMFTNAVTPH